MYIGLTKFEVEERQKKFGLNQLPKPSYRFLKLLLRQSAGLFNILLIVAGIVTVFLGEPIDAGLIFLFVILGIALSLYQEYKSNAAASTLQSYLKKTITVRRDNEDREIPTTDLVPGDILKLESGDIVPADAYILHAIGAKVDETTFTGESIPVVKVARNQNDPTQGKHEYDLLQGVVILTGTIYAEVTKTASETRLASIAESTSTIQSHSELTKGIDRISSFILRATLVTLLFVVIANVVIEGGDADIPLLLVFAIALAISVIPEALPLVITFSLSRGALRLAKKNVIVKRLSSVQDLGSVELLCTDKTGTITENHLVYKNDYLIPGLPYHPLIFAWLSAHNLHERVPEPFDHAIDEALSTDQRNQLKDFELLEEEAFDPSLRSNGSIVKRVDGQQFHIRRGSPEYFFSQGLANKDNFSNWLEAEEDQGRRILGISYDDGSGPRFGGFISFADTLKASTARTILAARDLNLAITIITGDAVRVAHAIGRETGLVTKNDEVIEASNFFAMDALKQRDLVGQIRVFARTTPEQKLRLLELLKEKYTVGFLGEGINDAPALKSAHVSMVVESASDVARETADIILTRQDLGVIIEGIRLGRETHANILKYIRATLVSNFGNFYAVAIGSLFISFLPMLPKQLLLLNLLSDFPMMAIAFDRVSRSEIKKPQRYDFRSLYIIFITLGLVSTVFDFMWFALFYKISPEVLQTNWFIASVLTEVALLFSIRSMLPIEKAGWPAPIIIWLSGFAILLAILLPIIPITAAFFSFVPPLASHLVLILCLVAVYFLVSESVKRPLGRFLKIT